MSFAQLNYYFRSEFRREVFGEFKDLPKNRQAVSQEDLKNLIANISP